METELNVHCPECESMYNSAFGCPVCKNFTCPICSSVEKMPLGNCENCLDIVCIDCAITCRICEMGLCEKCYYNENDAVPEPSTLIPGSIGTSFSDRLLGICDSCMKEIF